MSATIKVTCPCPGSLCGGRMLDAKGKGMLLRAGHPVKGRVVADPEVIELQSSPDKAPEPHLNLHVDIEGTSPYIVRMKLADFNDKKLFEQAMKDGRLPTGVEFTEALRDGVIGLSFVKETFPEYADDFYSTKDGMFEDGKRLSNSTFTIVDVVENEYHEKSYVVRGSDSKRVTVSAQDMQKGNYAHLLGPNVQIFDALSLWLRLRREWLARTPEELKSFDDELQRQRQAESMRELQERREREVKNRWRSR